MTVSTGTDLVNFRLCFLFSWMLRRASVYDQNITWSMKVEKSRSSCSNSLQEWTPSTSAGPKVPHGSAPAEIPSWGRRNCRDNGHGRNKNLKIQQKAPALLHRTCTSFLRGKNMKSLLEAKHWFLTVSSYSWCRSSKSFFLLWQMTKCKRNSFSVIVPSSIYSKTMRFLKIITTVIQTLKKAKLYPYRVGSFFFLWNNAS